MRILDGRPVREAVLAELKQRVAGSPRPPGLAVILVGDDPASRVYVGQKGKACTRVGYHHVSHRLPANTPEAELVALIEGLNAADDIDGILVQMPLPGHLDTDRVLMAVSPEKDVDGFHPENLGHLVSGRPRTVACTPRGVLRLLAHYEIGVAGRRVAVVGRSLIVGRPMALLLNLKETMGDATVVMCHSRTPDLAAETRRADVVIAALGRPGFLTRDHVAGGGVVVDVGINRVDDPAAKKGYRLVGDVDAVAMQGHAAALTPVPGGVGPMTIAMLLENTWDAMVRREGLA